MLALISWHLQRQLPKQRRSALLQNSYLDQRKERLILDGLGAMTVWCLGMS